MKLSRKWIWATCCLMLVSLSFVGPAAHAEPDCQSADVGGLIGDVWRNFQGPQGPLGCPLTDEFPGPRGGTIRKFMNGSIAWSPSTGDRSMQVAYRIGNEIVVYWGHTDPFSYDFFIVRWDKNGNHDENDGQADVFYQGRTWGWFHYPNADPNLAYTFIVEGCDNPGDADCNQSWSNPVTVEVADPLYRPWMPHVH